MRATIVPGATVSPTGASSEATTPANGAVTVRSSRAAAAASRAACARATLGGRGGRRGIRGPSPACRAASRWARAAVERGPGPAHLGIRGAAGPRPRGRPVTLGIGRDRRPAFASSIDARRDVDLGGCLLRGGRLAWRCVGRRGIERGLGRRDVGLGRGRVETHERRPGGHRVALRREDLATVPAPAGALSSASGDRHGPGVGHDRGGRRRRAAAVGEAVASPARRAAAAQQPGAGDDGDDDDDEDEDGFDGS